MVAAYVCARVRHVCFAKRLVAALFLAVAIFVLLFGSSCVMAFRDGLAPGMTVSTGWIALRRSILGVVFMAALATFIALPGLFVLRPYDDKRG